MGDSLIVVPNSSGSLKLPAPLVADIVLSLTSKRVITYVTDGDEGSSNPRISSPAAVFLDEQLGRGLKRGHLSSFLGYGFPDKGLAENKKLEIIDEGLIVLPGNILALFADSKRRAHILLLRGHRGLSIEGFAVSFQPKFPTGHKNRI